MERYEINSKLENFQSSLNDFKEILNIDLLVKNISELESQTTQPDFWNDSQKAQEIIQKLNGYKEKLENINILDNMFEEIKLLLSFYDEAGDNDSLEEAIDKINKMDLLIQKTNLEILLKEEYDSYDAILELHPGAGGTESQDWCEMLYRMYTRWAEKNNHKINVIDYQIGDEAGIKSVTIEISGKNVYGYLKGEKGVHRLVRISPFDSNSRRHTSFVSCDIMPKIEGKISIEIDENDLKIDTYRSSGAGGQSVNTTDSAVRITHIPTNTVVTCQNERSQIKNREKAMQVLEARLFALMIENQKKELNELRGIKKEIGWGSQIRSYVFHPYSMVKDHRTNFETSNPQNVMDGNLDDFIFAYLKYNATGDSNEK